jgi:hypothetical protein
MSKHTITGEYIDHISESWNAPGGGREAVEKAVADDFQKGIEGMIETLAKQLYEADGFNYGCLPTEEAWAKDRENIRERYRKLANDRIEADALAAQVLNEGVQINYVYRRDEMTREDAVRLLVHAAKEHRAAMTEYADQPHILRPESLLVLAYEQAVRDRVYGSCRSDTISQATIDDAKKKAGEYADAIVRQGTFPPYVHGVRCDHCGSSKQYADIMMLLGDVCLLWQKYLPAFGGER